MDGILSTILEEMEMEYKSSNERFSGNELRFRWRSGKEVLMYAPDDREAIAYPGHAGRCWLSFERSGREIREGSALWTINVDIGLNLISGLRVVVNFTSFPVENFSELMHSAEYAVASLEEWAVFKKTVLDELTQLGKHVMDVSESAAFVE
jgi:hypothetical protein